MIGASMSWLSSSVTVTTSPAFQPSPHATSRRFASSPARARAATAASVVNPAANCRRIVRSSTWVASRSLPGIGLLRLGARDVVLERALHRLGDLLVGLRQRDRLSLRLDGLLDQAALVLRAG